jgi:transposase
MSRKRPRPEAIVAKLRQADVLIGQGTSVAEAIQAIGVSEVTYATNCWTERSSIACGRRRS